MKKLSKSLLVFASAAMILANGFFVSCSNGDDGDSTPTVTTPKPGADNGNNGGNQNGNGNGTGNNGGNQNENGNGTGNNGGNQNENGNGNGNGGTSFTAPDLSTYYKKYFVGGAATADKFGINPSDWGTGVTATKNDADGSYSLGSKQAWGLELVVAAFSGFDEGTLANFEYLALTLDTSNYTISSGEGNNNGVNVKIAKQGGAGTDKQLAITDKSVKNADGTTTYYAKLSDFEGAPAASNEFALIAGGSGTLVVKEIYAAAKENPANNIDSLKATLRNRLASAKTLLGTAEANKGNDAGKYPSTVVDALSSAVSDAEAELSKDNATVDSINTVSQALATAVSNCVINTYHSPAALTENVNAIAKVFVTDEKISGNQLAITEYTQTWNGGWTTTDYTTSDSVGVKVVKFSSISGDNACGAWVFDKSNILTPSNGKTLYLHFDYISSSAFDINFPQGGDHWLTPSENSTKDANGWTSADISLSGIDMTEVFQFGWRSKVVQNIYVTNAYFYEK